METGELVSLNYAIKSFSDLHTTCFSITLFLDRGKFVVYSRGEGHTLVLLLHGGGYSGKKWVLCTRCEYMISRKPR